MGLLDHPPALFAVFFCALAFAVEAGYRLGAATNANSDETRHEQAVALRDSLGILLSLLLGFTLAMALPRFDQRKQLTMDEANSIGTAILRAQLLQEPARSQTTSLLRSYVDTRINFSEASLRGPEFETAVVRSKQLQDQLWREAADSARQNPVPLASLFLQSLNEMIDLSEKRLAALENRIPHPVWIMLALISLLTALAFGYSARRRVWLLTLIMPLMIAIVVGLIADLDSPRSGFIRNDQRSLVRLQHDLAAQPLQQPKPAETKPQ